MGSTTDSVCDEDIMDDLITLPFPTANDSDCEIVSVSENMCRPPLKKKVQTVKEANAETTSAYGNRTFILSGKFFDNARNISLLTRCRRLSINVVDCGKFPWYYRKKYGVKKPRPKSKQVFTLQNLLQDMSFQNKLKQQKTAQEYDKSKCKLKNKSKEVVGKVSLTPSKCSDVDFKRNTGLVGLKIERKLVGLINPDKMDSKVTDSSKTKSDQPKNKKAEHVKNNANILKERDKDLNHAVAEKVKKNIFAEQTSLKCSVKLSPAMTPILKEKKDDNVASKNFTNTTTKTDCIMTHIGSSIATHVLSKTIQCSTTNYKTLKMVTSKIDKEKNKMVKAKVVKLDQIPVESVIPKSNKVLISNISAHKKNMKHKANIKSTLKKIPEQHSKQNQNITQPKVAKELNKKTEQHKEKTFDKGKEQDQNKVLEPNKITKKNKENENSEPEKANTIIMPVIVEIKSEALDVSCIKKENLEDPLDIRKELNSVLVQNPSVTEYPVAETRNPLREFRRPSVDCSALSNDFTNDPVTSIVNVLPNNYLPTSNHNGVDHVQNESWEWETTSGSGKQISDESAAKDVASSENSNTSPVQVKAPENNGRSSNRQVGDLKVQTVTQINNSVRNPYISVSDNNNLAVAHISQPNSCEDHQLPGSLKEVHHKDALTANSSPVRKQGCPQGSVTPTNARNIRYVYSPRPNYNDYLPRRPTSGPLTPWQQNRNHMNNFPFLTRQLNRPLLYPSSQLYGGNRQPHPNYYQNTYMPSPPHPNYYNNSFSILPPPPPNTPYPRTWGPRPQHANANRQQYPAPLKNIPNDWLNLLPTTSAPLNSPNPETSQCGAEKSQMESQHIGKQACNRSSPMPPPPPPPIAETNSTNPNMSQNTISTSLNSTPETEASISQAVNTAGILYPNTTFSEETISHAIYTHGQQNNNNNRVLIQVQTSGSNVKTINNIKTVVDKPLDMPVIDNNNFEKRIKPAYTTPSPEKNIQKPKPNSVKKSSPPLYHRISQGPKKIPNNRKLDLSNNNDTISALSESAATADISVPAVLEKVVRKGYSAPILPIPTVKKSLEILALANAMKTPDVSQNEPPVRLIEGKNKFIGQHVKFQKLPKFCIIENPPHKRKPKPDVNIPSKMRRISIEEYKKRAGTVELTE